MRSTILIALLAVGTSSAASSAPLGLPEFTSVELHGSAEITLKHGAVQQVILQEGSTAVSSFNVDSAGRLIIRSCQSNCNNYRLRVVITRPSFEALAVQGGGNIRAAEQFPQQERLSLSVAAGGSLDAGGIPGRRVAARVRSGGSIVASASSALAAAVAGGGSVIYRGNPSVSSNISGAGSVTRE